MLSDTYIEFVESLLEASESDQLGWKQEDEALNKYALNRDSLTVMIANFWDDEASESVAVLELWGPPAGSPSNQMGLSALLGMRTLRDSLIRYKSQGGYELLTTLWEAARREANDVDGFIRDFTKHLRESNR
jgi:hypothetical protein